MKILQKFDGKKVQIKLTADDLSTLIHGTAIAGNYLKARGEANLANYLLDMWWNLKRVKQKLTPLPKDQVAICREKHIAVHGQK